MRKPRLRRWTCFVLILAIAGGMALPWVYQHVVTARLARDLDARHGEKGWAVRWRTADGQSGEGIALYRTLYVRFLSPRLQNLTPWKALTFTHKTTTPNRPWHYAVCVVSGGSEITYFWSIKKHRWIPVWHNQIADSPIDVRQNHAVRLRNVERLEGLNWSIDDENEI